MKSRLLYFFAVVAAAALIPAARFLPVAGDGSPVLRIKAPDGSIYETGAEEYTALVVAAEYGAVTEPEALKALAVTVRSAAYYVRIHGLNHKNADFCSSADCCFQVAEMDTVSEEAYEAAKKAVEATEGITLCSGGSPAMGLYTLCSCGGTRDCKAFPEIKGVALDRRCEKHTVKKTLPADELFSRFGNGSEDICLVLDGDGFCKFAVIGGASVDPCGLAGYAGLDSERFTAETDGNGGVVFCCRGAGNGYGLDLCYAEEAAKAGGTYEDILKLFYPEYDISRQNNG